MLVMHVHKTVHQHEHMHGTREVPFALHRSIVCVDVEKFGVRANWDQLAVRDALFRALETALAESRVPAEHVTCEDRGDGALILVDPAVPKEHLAGPFPARLAACLERHNGTAAPGARFRLRAAVHAGEVHYDRHGVAGSAVSLRRTAAVSSGPASPWTWTRCARSSHRWPSPQRWKHIGSPGNGCGTRPRG